MSARAGRRRRVPRLAPRSAQVGWLGCAGSPAGKAATTAEAPPAPGKVLDDLALLAIGVPLDEPRRRDLDARLSGGRLSLESYVAELLADPRFAADVAPEILFNKKAVDPSEEEAGETLKVTATEPPVYFLREPCDARSAVPVHPWWALDAEVLVCPDSYQPTHLRQAETGWYCGGTNLDPARSPFCGCGPNLMNCTRDDAQAAAVKHALQEELLETVAYVVGRDLPLSRLFTMNETVRTGYSELVYQRWQVVAGQRAGVSDVRAFAGEGKLTPRLEAVAGQHAGLLTAPHLLLYGDTPRARMRNAFNDLWCVTPASVNVTTEQVLGLGVTDLRDGDGWKKLAVMPVCTDCHARLDHGMQFFSGYPSSFVGVVYHAPEGHPLPQTLADDGAPPGRSPALPQTPGADRGFLYGRDAGDLRGEAPLDPRHFAALAVKQPEFGRCMARDVADHVFNGDATAEDRRALVAAYDAAGTLRAVMREALLRYARRASERRGRGAAGGDLAEPDRRPLPGLPRERRARVPQGWSLRARAPPEDAAPGRLRRHAAGARGR